MPMPSGQTADQMIPGTIVELGLRVIRRRPYATIGLPWKSYLGARYSHDEVDALLADGATVSICDTCSAGQRCEAHDAAAAATRPDPANQGAPVVGHDRVTGVPLCEHGDDAAACQLAHQGVPC
jgi:hypothetical protein